MTQSVFTKEVVDNARSDLETYNNRFANKTITISQNPLESKIAQWLYVNKGLEESERAKKVKEMLSNLNHEELLDYSVSVALGYCSMLEIVNASMAAVTGIHNLNNALHAECRRISGKTANGKRIQKYKNIKEELKEYWENYIDPNKRATDAAPLLERTDVYKKYNTKPKRSTLETYIREWQRLRN